MMKLSKISKVILISGMLLAFSCGYSYATGGNGNGTLEGVFGEGAATSSGSGNNAGSGNKSSVQTDCSNLKGSAKKACEANKKAAAAKAAAAAAQQKANEKGGSTTTKTTTKKDGSVEVTSNSSGDWGKAQEKKNTAQRDYTAASTAYNKCVAQKGIAKCASEKDAMDAAKGSLDKASKAYNQAQKDASKAYYENQKAQAKADKAEAKAAKADQKALDKAQKAYDKCLEKKKKGKVDSCDTEAAAVQKAKENVDSHKTMVTGGSEGATSQLDKLKNAVTGADGNAAAADALNNLRIYKENKEAAAKKAEEECERYSAMTSKDAQKKAQSACAKAVQLRSEADAAASAYAEVGAGISATGATAAEGRLKASHSLRDGNWDSTGHGGRELIGINAQGNAIGGDGENTYNFNYKSSGDVLETVTRRAALAVVGLKPIVYIFAGFGLIAFAWMAIFNKISWKWFANIAMGLFLVANMGRLIEYFVADGSSDGGYYVGVWNDSAKSQKPADRRLANAFHDVYYVYGDLRYHEKGIRDFNWGDVLSTSSTDVFSASARGFCQGTSGSGFANFTSCMGDILASVKKATDTVKTVKAAAEDMVARVEAVADTAKNIGQMATAMVNAAKSGDVTGILENMGNMMGQANKIVSTTTGAVGSLTNAVSSVTNNIQDIGKSTDQQKELADRRASGEATNKLDAMLKGQEWNAATGGVEKVDGQYASQDSWVSMTNDIANQVRDQAANLTSMGTSATQMVGSVTNIVQTTSVKDLTGFGSDKTINDKIAQNRDKKAVQANERANAAAQAAYQESNAGKNAAYREQNNATNQLYSNMKAQENEAKNLQTQKDNAQKAVEKNCSDPDSAMCKASKAQLESADAALKAKQEQLAATEKQYNAAKEELDNKYNTALQSNIDEAQKSYDAAAKKADEACKANPSGSACAEARSQALAAANLLSSYVTEKEKKTNAGRYETKEQVDVKIADNASVQEQKRLDERLKYEEEQAAKRLQNEASYAKQEYEKAMDNANNLYTQMNAQEQEAKVLEEQAKAKSNEAAQACSRDASSSVCTSAKIAAQSAREAADNKKEQVKQTKSDYEEAKSHAETAYNKSVTAGIVQAQRDYDNAQNQQKRAKEIIEAADKEMDGASAAAKKAEEEYNASMSDAQAARKAYEEARSSGKSQEEIDTLKAEYDAKLKAMNEADKEYQKTSKAYKDLQQQKKDAQKSYNEAYAKANDAGNRLASYTNEDVNKTGESRLNSNEDIDNQALINQYKSETNPAAVAQASKNNYIARKNDADAAQSKLKEKQAVAEQARIAYENALRKAQESGSEADRRVAERLRNNYTLATNEVTEAQQTYDRAAKELGGYEADYINKAIDAEKYNQTIYSEQMKQASADINKYEQEVNKQRKVVDSAGTAYTSARSAAASGDKAKEQKAAQLYNEYKKAKETYDSYVKNFNQAKNTYTTAQSNYQKSVNEQARLEKLRKG